MSDDRVVPIRDFEAWNKEMRALQHGGGGGTSDGMEVRIARLESDMEHVKKTLDRVAGSQDTSRDDIATLKIGAAVLDERVKHLPTKGWMVGAMGTSLALIAALIAFGEKLQALIH